MTTTDVGLARSDGTTLAALVSLDVLSGLDADATAALGALGIRSLGDLLRFGPIHDARLVLRVERRGLAHDLVIEEYVDTAAVAADSRLGELSASRLVRLSPAHAAVLAEAFGVRTIAQLAEFGPFEEAESLAGADAFFEEVSAPAALLPRLVGNATTTARFNTWVRSGDLSVPKATLHLDTMSDSGFASLFTARAAVFGLGYVASHRQRWTNRGTQLGEVLHSLALAPGESRAIAVIDWTRKQRSGRDEDTVIDERLRNEETHSRALDEVTSATAREHQKGRTSTRAATSTTSTGLTAGRGDTFGSSAAAGATVPIDGVPVELRGAATTSRASSIGGSAVFSNATQEGTIRTETTSTRDLLSQVQQDITDTTVQNASNVRSLRSSIVVSDEQGESESASTRSVVNYNHMHALTVQYYEVLQRYEVGVTTDTITPVLYLPFTPIDFTIDTIRRYWAFLRVAVHEDSPRLAEQFENLLHGYGRSIEFDRDAQLLLRRLDVTVRSRDDLGSVVLSVVDEQGQDLLGVLARVTPRRIDNFAGASTIPLDRVGAVLLAGGNLYAGSRIPLSLGFELTVVDSDDNTATVLVVEEVDHRHFALTTAIDSLAQRAHQVLAATDHIVPSHAIRAVEEHFRRRRFAYTRFLLDAVEPEQLAEELRRLVVTVDGRDVALTHVVDPEPLGITGNHLILPIRTGASRKLTGSSPLVVRDGRISSELAGVPSDLAGLNGTVRIETATEDGTTVETVEAACTTASRQVGEQISVEFALTRRRTSSRAVGALLITRRKDRGDASDGADPVRHHLEGTLDLARDRVSFHGHLVPRPGGSPGKISVELETAALVGEGAAGDQLSEQIEAFTRSLPAPGVLSEVQETVFLPTSGVFAEAILGRANASEKIDRTRFFNWQDSPIPHQAPQISPLQLGGRTQPIANLEATVTDGVLNVATPPTFPEPATAAATLAALNNPALFRDVSGAGTLGTVLTNLSALARDSAQLAGTLADDARSSTLAAAVDIGTAVTELAGRIAPTFADPQPRPAPGPDGGWPGARSGWWWPGARSGWWWPGRRRRA